LSFPDKLLLPTMAGFRIEAEPIKGPLFGSSCRENSGLSSSRITGIKAIPVALTPLRSNLTDTARLNRNQNSNISRKDAKSAKEKKDSELGALGVLARE
jgi:hypothetical protein